MVRFKVINGSAKQGYTRSSFGLYPDPYPSRVRTPSQGYGYPWGYTPARVSAGVYTQFWVIFDDSSIFIGSFTCRIPLE